MHHRGNSRPVDRLGVVGVDPKPPLKPTGQAEVETGGRGRDMTRRRTEEGKVEDALGPHFSSGALGEGREKLVPFLNGADELGCKC